MGQHRYQNWKRSHYGKRRYRTRRRAWLVIARIWLRERHVDSLQPYACRWGGDYSAGRSAPLHVHIGHGRYSLSSRARHQLNKRVAWPYFRLRSRWRKFRRQGGRRGP